MRFFIFLDHRVGDQGPGLLPAGQLIDVIRDLRFVDGNIVGRVIPHAGHPFVLEGLVHAIAQGTEHIIAAAFRPLAGNAPRIDIGSLNAHHLLFVARGVKLAFFVRNQ